MVKTFHNISMMRRWIEARFSRSPGPGGQNVNKLNTRVTLLFDFEACSELSEVLKAKIRRRFRTRLARDGRLLVVRHRERTQRRNREAAEIKILELLAEVLQPVKVRKPTKPTLGAKRRRLEDKQRRSDLKRLRRRTEPD